MDKIKNDLQEIYRVTKTGGYVYIESDQQYVWKRRLFYTQFKTDEKGTYKHASGGNYYHYFTKEELRALLKNYKTIRFYFKNRKFYILVQK